MTWSSIILSLIGYTIFNYVMFQTITRKELFFTKIYFFMSFFLSGITIGLYPFIITNNPSSDGTINLIATVYFLNILLGIFIFVWNWFIKIILQSLKDVDDKSKAINKKEKEEFI